MQKGYHKNKIINIKRRKIIERKVNKTKDWFYENIIKLILNLLADLSKKRERKRENTNHQCQERGDTTTDIKKISYEKPYVNKFENLDQIDTFLERHKLSKLTQEEVDHLNSSIAIKNLYLQLNPSSLPHPPKSPSGSDGLSAKFQHTGNF